MLSTRLLRAAFTQTAAPVEPAFVHLPLTRWPSSNLQTEQQQQHEDGLTQSTSPASSSSSSSSSSIDTLVTLPSDIFHAPSRPDILHQCVVAHLASLRQGTAHTKNRAEVRGSNRKIQRQKGSGRARVGDVASPIRRGGGRAFPKRQRDFSIGLNEKVWRLGVRTALSERWRRGELAIIPTPPTLETISTRSLSNSLSAFPDVLSSSSTTPSTAFKVLFLVSSLDSNFALSARNIPNVSVELVDDIDVYPLLQGDRVVLDLEAVQILDDWLGRRDQTTTQSSMSESEEMEMSSTTTPQKNNWPTEDGSDTGSKFSNDPEVIEEEEAPVIWKRFPNDPLKRKEALDKIYREKGEEYGDRVKDHMEEIGKRQQ